MVYESFINSLERQMAWPVWQKLIVRSRMDMISIH